VYLLHPSEQATDHQARTHDYEQIENPANNFHTVSPQNLK
jgi:hypothetical protein